MQDQEQDRIPSLSQKPSMKLKSPNKPTIYEIATNETRVKQEVDYEIHLEKTDILDGGHSNNIVESMTIKS